MRYKSKDRANIDRATIFMEKAAYALEIIVGLILITAILISIVPVMENISSAYVSFGEDVDFNLLLEDIFTVIIGIEFLKMICKHDMDSVIEVLLFTLARKMIVEHGSSVDNLFIIIAIAILFAIRRYLFVDRIGKD